VYELWKSGMTRVEIANIIGATSRIVTYHLQKKGVRNIHHICPKCGFEFRVRANEQGIK
jgi:DNA-binding CsgD family transcriptional regulator